MTKQTTTDSAMAKETESLLFSGDSPFVIAGPCSAETPEQLIEIAQRLPKDKTHVLRAGIWKPRTKPNAFEGVGKEGLQWLQEAGKEAQLPTATEVATAKHVELALNAGIDILWIGARTTVNPFQVQEIAEALQGTSKWVFVKNPVNPDLALWMGAIERLQNQAIKNIGAIHRGFSTYKKEKFRNTPHWQIPLDLKKEWPNIPMICDPSHISGKREWIYDIAQKALNFGFEGLMIETHSCPDKAWSDAAQQVTPEVLHEILKQLKTRSLSDTDLDYHQAMILLREQIDAKDEQLLSLLHERMEISKQIGILKKTHNVTLFQSDRWKEINCRLAKLAGSFELSPRFSKDYLEAVHQESLRVQNQIMSETKP